ncbi:MAG TPA: TonB family protein [Terracidiphilus sp.]|jgi:TonB family protein
MTSTAICTEREGTIVDGRFTLQRWLGGCQECGVYLTETAEGDGTRKAAIKLVAAGTADAERRAAGWTAAARLSHPHLIQVLDTGRCAMDGSEFLYAVTEFADEVLAEIIPERPLTPDETREMLGPVLDALTYLHEQGFAHGRLKPSNILVVEDKLKLSADCVSLADTAEMKLPDGGVYDAPELARGEISPAADVWSLGITLVTALTQHPPARESAASEQPPVPPSVPEPFAGIARECLRLDPARRCTLSEIKARLEGKAVPASAAPITPIATATQPAAPLVEAAIPGSRRILSGRAAVLITAAVLLAGIGAAMLVHFRQAPASPDQSSNDQPAASAPSTAAPSPSTGAEVQPPAPATAATPAARHGDGQRGAAKGEVAKRVLPDVPSKARATIEGKVVIKVQAEVDANGDVSDAVSQSPAASKYFNRLTLEAARAWKFTPPQEDGSPAPSVWTLRFAFSQDGTEATAVETTP